jgi:hypothetical protein
MRGDIPHSYLKTLIQDYDSHQPITNSKEQKQERKIYRLIRTQTAKDEEWTRGEKK